jgi:hypothetical protein
MKSYYFGFSFFYAFWLWVVRIFLGLVFFLVVGVVFLCWFFCRGWLGLVRATSCLEKGTIMKGIREFRVQAVKREYAGEVSAWLGDLKSRRMVVEFCDDLHGETRGSWSFSKDQERVEALIRRRSPLDRADVYAVF